MTWPRCEWVVIGPTAKLAYGTTFPNHTGTQYASVSAAVSSIVCWRFCLSLVLAGRLRRKAGALMRPTRGSALRSTL